MKSPHQIRPAVISELEPDMLAMLQYLSGAQPIIENCVHAAPERGALFIANGGQYVFALLTADDLTAAVHYLKAGEITGAELVACLQYGPRMALTVV
mgnify:CR=1 FL=1